MTGIQSSSGMDAHSNLITKVREGRQKASVATVLWEHLQAEGCRTLEIKN